jgi:hypothetical protein
LYAIDCELGYAQIKRRQCEFKSMKVSFGYTIIYVADVVATLAFYEKAFGLKRRFLHESNFMASLKPAARLWPLRVKPWPT